MSFSTNDRRNIVLSIQEPAQLCPVAKALASNMRVRMLELLSLRPMNVNELAEALSMPVSTAALNVRQLEDAGLITSEIQPGIRGAMKLCSRCVDSVSISLVPKTNEGLCAFSLQLPVGSYSSADVEGSDCGLVSEKGWIGEKRKPVTFYHPARAQAQLLWMQSGELEYRFAPDFIDALDWLEISMEIVALPAGTSSSVSLSVNQQPLGLCAAPAEPSPRRGSLNPAWWSEEGMQHGQLMIWRVDQNGCTLNGEPLSDVSLSSLALDESGFISLRLGFSGGVALFGEKFGNFAQSILVRAGKNM